MQCYISLKHARALNDEARGDELWWVLMCNALGLKPRR